MGFTEDYLALKEKRKKKEKEEQKTTGHSFTDEYLALKKKRTEGQTEDIAPVFVNKTAALYGVEREIAPTKTEKDERKWFEKGAFEDGYQFGDISKTILGTGTDIKENLFSGIIGMGEKVVDAGAYLVGGAAGLLGADGFKDKTADFIKKDLYDEEKVAKKLIGVSASGVFNDTVGIDTEEDSVLGEKSDALVQSGGQLLATAGLQVAGVPWFVTSGVTSFGSEAENALNEGASYGGAGLSAAISAGAEILTEKISGGISFGGKALDDVLTQRIARGVSNKVVRTLSKLGLDMAGEGTEEVLSGVMSAIGQKITYADDKELTELFSVEDALESFIGGAVLGGVSSGKNALIAKGEKVDFVSGLTANEKAVVDKLFADRVAEAEKSGNVTEKQKDAIYSEVLRDMERGYISTDTIEEVLGGESYQTYKQTVDSEDAILKEYEELGNKQNATLAEQTRYNELHQQVGEIKANSQRRLHKAMLSENVYEAVKNDRLFESYKEDARRGQAFEADLTQYDTKQQETIKKAVESGILNNTNRTHEFVDMIAKITADKGVLFDFTNNEKLKGSGFAVDGKFVNGYLDKATRTIGVNIDSAKALNTVVGHEVTHVLEGTELYDVLSETVIEYAKSKGEYQGRYDALSKLYEEKDIPSEMTADLVGEYLFTDEDFVRNLSVQHRNVFQKIYDEIKYLCKVATAGSKEARELEKVKRAFEKAYKESGKQQSDTNQIKSVANEKPTADADIRYSLSDSEGKPIDTARISQDEFDTRYSLSHNDEIAKGQSNYLLNHKAHVTDDELKEAQRVTNAMVDVMMKYSSILPEDKIGKVLTKNGSYDRSVENTTICVRTLAYNEFVDKVQEEIGRPLTQMESFLVSQKLYDIATDPQCLYCYVSLDRKAFNDMLLRYMQDRDTVIAKYNNSDKSPEAISALYTEFLNGRKDTKPMKDRFNKWLDYVDNGTQLLSLADIATEDRQSVIKANGGNLAAQLADARAYAQSASWSKIQKDYVAYRDEILKLGDRVVQNLNEHYGLRWYSFSDYSAAFIVENMQQITDASIRGLNGLAYTKDTDFVEIFAPSGMNINVSVFVNIDENGNFFIDEKQSADFRKALELRERYPNVGIVATVTNDEALRWAASQEWSDVIIPFHIVRTGTDVAEYYKWLNYTAESADTIKDADIWNSYLDSLNLKSDGARKKVSKNIYPNEHKNDKDTYLNLCESRGLTPRFVRFAGEDWYMKLVNETRLSADASSPLKPVYNEDAAKASFQKFVEKGGYEGGWYKKAINVDAEAKAVAADVLAGKKANEVDYGRQDNFAPEALLAGRKANRKHGQHSLSEIGEQFAPVGKYNVYGKDMKLVDFSNPEADFNAESNAESNTENRVGDMLPDDLAPMADDPQRFDSLTDADAPAEAEAPYAEYGEVTASDPFDERDWHEVGNQKVKAYMYENPEVKPFFQEQAAVLLDELQNTTKGEKWYNDEVYYQSGGEAGFGGTKRITSDSIAELRDSWGMSYADIEKGLNAIIDDHGAENIAAAKKIEFMLNDRLMNGYKSFVRWEPMMDRYGNVPPDEGYIKLINEKQISQYSKESFDALMANADQYAPAEDIAPVAKPAKQEAFEAIRPKPQKEPRMAKATPAEQARAEILVDEPKVDKKKGGVMSKLKNLVLDKGMVFEDLSLKTGNRELQARWDSIRRAESRAQRHMEKSLKPVIETVEKTGKTKQFYEYLYHLHNADRMSLEDRFEDVQNKPVFGYSVTADMSKDEAAKLEKANPEFKQWAESVYAYNRQNRELLVESGVISREVANLWEEMYPHYVPIRRDGDEGLNINVPLDTGKTGVNAPIKRATGGSRDILPLFDTMGQRTIQTFKAIAKNRFGVELKNTLGTTVDNDAMSVDEFIESLDTQDSLLQEGKDGRSPTFTVFENGEKVTFEITDEMYDAMKPKSDVLAYTNKALNTISNVRRGVITEYNPWFLLKNAVKDTQDVLINSQHPAKTYAAIPKAIKHMASNGHWYQEYLDNGGEQNTYFESDTNTFAEENKTAALLKKVTGLDAISKANNVIERLPRLAEYIASREAGRSVDVAMLDAARVTTNFAAGGDLTKFLNRNGATFLNASVQGAMQNVRNFREAKMNGLKGWASLAGKFAIAGLPAIVLNHFIWDDDEEYEELSDYVKENYYIVGKYGDGKFVRIPKGRTVAVIQNAIEQVSNAATGNDEADLRGFLELVISNLAPNNPIDNNILSPILQVAKNKTWYGEDLVPTRLADLPKAEQFDESTDAISRWLGETFNISPVKANYLLDQYSGVVGDTFLPMLTPEAESGDDSLLGNMIAPLKDMFTTDSVMNNQNVSDFYDKKDELTVNANASGATKEDVLKNKYMNAVNADLAKLYAEKRKIQNSDLPDAEKYAAVRDVQEQIVELTKEGLNSYGDISYEDDYREGGEYARVNDRLYKLNDEGEWTKLSDDQATKYEVTKAAGNAAYASDGTNHYRWYVPGEDASEDTKPGWRKITDEQLEKQEEVTKGLGISAEEYWNGKEEHDYAYEHPENYAVAKAVGGYDAYRSYSGELYDIKADKDSNGKSISGSRKEKVIEYINGLDIEAGEKYILFKSEYNADDTYNYEIIDYLNSREDISYDETVTILKKLGFTVDSQGNIYW